MRAKYLALSGFITFALFQLVMVLYMRLTGSWPTNLIARTPGQIAFLLLLLSVGMGLMGALVGVGFRTVQRFLPPVKREYQAVIYFVGLDIVLSAFTTGDSRSSADFAVSVISMVAAAFLFTWLYRRFGGDVPAA